MKRTIILKKYYEDKLCHNFQIYYIIFLKYKIRMLPMSTNNIVQYQCQILPFSWMSSLSFALILKPSKHPVVCMFDMSFKLFKYLLTYLLVFSHLQIVMLEGPLWPKMASHQHLPSGKLAVCYWKWTIYSWFTYCK